MHKRKPDFDPLKFTPSVIHNHIVLPTNELIEYFSVHSLNECAEKFKCSKITIKRKLRAAGIDTSIHNHSQLAIDRRSVGNNKIKPTKDELYSLYVVENFDTKTIAEMYGLHYNTIRKLVLKFGFKKDHYKVSASMMQRHLLKHGVKHPAQRPDVLAKTSISLHKAMYKNYCFKSITELGYALYLDKLGFEWYYEDMHIPYVDMLSGKRRIYVIDFTVLINDTINWIEVKPNNSMIPEDKRIYAMRRAEEIGAIYRGIYDTERVDLWRLIEDGYNFDMVEFLHRPPRSVSTKITYYFKNEAEALNFGIDGWKQFTRPTNRGALWKKILVRK